MTDQSTNQPARRRFHSQVSAQAPIGVTTLHAAQSNQPFRPLPAPTGQAPYHLALDGVLPPEKLASINEAQRMVFHLVGDTGGVKAPQAQQIVAMHMDDDFQSSRETDRPAFFFHLGDVVYYYGEASEYYPQFYEPYSHYPAPILAIPGNHDGDLLDDSVPSLAAFVENFCATEPHLTPESQDSGRDAMTQPNVYWTLEAPFLTIIGLYTNVPEGGELDDNQTQWLHSEMSGAPTDKALFVALHHPIYSLDTHHSGSQRMSQALDDAIKASGRIPDAVFAAHVHNYQRFTRRIEDRQVPYLVAGAGGYWHLHYVAKQFGAPIATPYTPPEATDVTLESYCDDRHGYLRLQITPTTLRGEYLAVPRPQESWNDPAVVIDTFTLDLQQHRLLP